MSSRQCAARVVMMVFILLLTVPSSLAWTPAVSSITRSTLLHPRRLASFVQKSSPVILFAEEGKKGDDESSDNKRATFDQAGASLIEEEDQKRMEQMGDFDQNDAYQTDSIEKMKAAIRDRTAELGVEKSKVTADYIAEKEKQALAAGPPGAAAQENPDLFGGLDLSQISRQKDEQGSQWNEDMPSMFYDPEEELTEEEMNEVDPVMLQNPIQQAWDELNKTKWPTMFFALREVGLILLIIAVSGVFIIGWDKVLRNLYTSIGFIPTKEELMNYATKFDGLDLPSGWTDNMNDADVQTFQDTVNSATSSGGVDIPDF